MNQLPFLKPIPETKQSQSKVPTLFSKIHVQGPGCTETPALRQQVLQLPSISQIQYNPAPMPAANLQPPQWQSSEAEAQQRVRKWLREYNPPASKQPISRVEEQGSGMFKFLKQH